ncbi:Peptidoglycan/LPS O-acetylase OafA/YrhL, contains acyltransferase and SGNH-hydrolase domains [Algoriphagus faecimaris]|uniref:Peptidoglycan/LPS O-acetylase OafA/YrhL, contains acyltransferase and SGNH-hydrolase domains n=1 Tax=Algoriphagus faecimaris TaxID=686796 RepID=A0A1G6PV18_9BACT|nr:acyltransferase [Algoriphagus faecimaris]SDC83939.1 Peptidoglycan/LPS O-acetylase OafA/YrhL, contains acyltransferase and SGNH-hydrolase domains [Algoriphagus faecimaris]
MNYWVRTFRRSTSSKNFIPEIDGLRFLAIATVVVFHFHFLLWRHLDGKVLMDVETSGILTAGWWLSRMDLGVKLFFGISGFILSIPFFNQYWFGGRKVDLKNYFIRRLTRLEPPFLVAITAFFCVHIGLLGASFLDLLPNYLATIFYVHTLIFNEYSVINPVTWSLETEVQFYLLIPFLAAWVLGPNSSKLKAILIGLFLFLGSIYLRGYYLSHGTFGMIANITGFFSHFLVGIVFAYLYLKKNRWLIKKNWVWDLVGFCSLIGIFYWYKPQAGFINQVLFNISIFVLFVAAFKSWVLNWFFTRSWVYLIGGMCYSIYLLHLPFFGLTSQLAQKYIFGNTFSLNFWIYLFPVLIGLMIISSVFYLLIEKPCMEKDWHLKVLKKLNLAQTR